MNNNFQFDLFVSYSWDNKEEVRELCKSLENIGYKLWLDINQMVHGNIDKIMKKGIDESLLFLCCATTSYCQSENAMKEFNYAVAKKKSIIYVLFEKFSGDNDRLEKLDAISWHFARQLFYKHNDIVSIGRAIEDLRIGL